VELRKASAVAGGRGHRVLRRIARRWRGAVAILLAWTIFVTAGSKPDVVEAQEPPPVLPPPPLLNPFLLSPGLRLNGTLYDATDAQRAALGRLEAQAVTKALTRFELPPSDAAAMKSWGRFETTGVLWALLVEAIETEPAARTEDQKLAVEWFTDVVKRQQVNAAVQTGLEYLHWAGLDDTAYRELIDEPGTPTEAAVRGTLAGDPVTYEWGVPPGMATTGYCVYHPPKAFESDYLGRGNQECFTPCTLIGGCLAPFPSFEQLKSWGAGRVNEKLIDSVEFAAVSREVSNTLILAGVAVAAGLIAAVVAAKVTAILTAQAIAVAALTAILDGASIGSVSASAGSLATAGIGMVAAFAAIAVITVILAILAAILGAILVIGGALLPHKIAELVVSAHGHVPDLRAQLGDRSQVAGMFNLFVGATLPSPKITSCDNGILIGGVRELPATCLNAPPIPGWSRNDPWFEVTERGSSQPTLTPTITVRDNATKIDSLTRLHDAWFIRRLTDKDGVSLDVQSLRLRYTDWENSQRTAIVVEGPSGWTFVQIKPTDHATGLDTCEQEGWCEKSTTIKYLGADGKHYSARVMPRPPAPPDTVAPTMSVSTGPALQKQGEQANVGVAFSEPVSGRPQLRLARDGVEVGVIKPVPQGCVITEGVDHCLPPSVFTTGFLNEEPGLYELTVLTEGVTDLAGNPVVGGDVTVSWTVVEQLRATVGPLPAVVAEPLDAATLTFNRAATVKLDDLVLTRDGTPVPWGAGIAVAPDGPAGEPATRWTITGLDSAQRDATGAVLEGVYRLSLRPRAFVTDVHGIEWEVGFWWGPGREAEFTVDTTDPPPTVTLTPGQPDGHAGWYRSPVTVAVTPAGGMVETRCVADPSEIPNSFADLPEDWQNCARVYGDGVHRLFAASRDHLADPGPISEVTFRVDQTAPTSSVVLNPVAPDGAQGWYVDPVSVTVEADDPTATMRCALNPEHEPVSFTDLPDRPCEGFTVARHGHHEVYAAAIDAAGNPGPVVARTFKSVGALRCQGLPPTHVGTSGADLLVGSAGHDVILALGGGDTIHGRGGDDLICAAAGNDQIQGGAGDDKVSGGADHDHITGGAGNDRLTGAVGNDRLTGGDDTDTIAGGPGRDQLSGRAADDHLTGGADPDRLFAGPGNDTVHAHAGNDIIIGYAGDDLLNGHSGNDLILAGTANDHLNGHAGHDRLLAGPGNDHLNGGPGNDLLDPGPGTDHITPGSGNDTTLGSTTTRR
jgi:RTX calcium-binding nonapeptide repeat (4 copies)